MTESTTNPSPQSRPPVEEDDRGEIIPEVRAKQGRKGFHMLAVLAASLTLVLVAFGTLFVFHAHPARDSNPAVVQANTRTEAKGAGPT